LENIRHDRRRRVTSETEGRSRPKGRYKVLEDAGYTVAVPPLIKELIVDLSDTHEWFDVYAEALLKDGERPERPVRIWFVKQTDSYGQPTRVFQRIGPIPVGVKPRRYSRLRLPHPQRVLPPPKQRLPPTVQPLLPDFGWAKRRRDGSLVRVN
jgi:hypothetical protein